MEHEAVSLGFFDVARVGFFPPSVLGAIVAATGAEIQPALTVRAWADGTEGGVIIIETAERKMYRCFESVRNALIMYDAIRAGEITPRPVGHGGEDVP